MGSRRADIIVVTKCPTGMTDADQMEKTNCIKKIAGEKFVFFTSIQYRKAISFGNVLSQITPDVILISGIANPTIFEDYVSRTFHVIKHFAFKDHHRYTKTELLAVREFMAGHSKPVSILTTEKDMVRLIDPEFLELVTNLPWFYLPIETVFIKDGSEFDKLVKNAIIDPA